MATLNKIIGGKEGNIRLEFQEKIVLPNSKPNLLGELNKSDERFNNVKPTLAWVNKVVPSDFIDTFEAIGAQGGEEVTLEMLNSLSEGEEIEVYQDDVKVKVGDKFVPVRIEITESITPINDYQMSNKEKAAKQLTIDGRILKSRLTLSDELKANIEDNMGKQAYFTDAEGNLIYRNVNVVAYAPQHIIIQNTKLVSAKEAFKIPVVKETVADKVAA